MAGTGHHDTGADHGKVLIGDALNRPIGACRRGVIETRLTTEHGADELLFCVWIALGLGDPERRECAGRGDRGDEEPDGNSASHIGTSNEALAKVRGSPYDEITSA